MAKNKKITVLDAGITITDDEYISLTDIAKYKTDDPSAAIGNWMRNRNTLEFLGLWEKLYNGNFKPIEFEGFRNEAGLNAFTMSPKKWVVATSAVGIIVKSGRYGGTYAHKDIAFKFASWISIEFELYLIKEFQRLKEIEQNSLNLEWSVKRLISKANYRLQTDAIQKHIIPQGNYSQEWLAYADEADILNVALFGCSAKEWRDANPERDKKGENIRDMASINELAVLSNLESLNAEMIHTGIKKSIRFQKLKEIATRQLSVLTDSNHLRDIKRLSERTLLDSEEKS